MQSARRVKKIVILVILIASFTNLFCVEPLSLNTFFTKDEIQRTFNGEIIPRMFVKYNSRKENSHEEIIIPATKYIDEDFTTYEIISDEKSFIPYKLTEKSKIDFYNILSSFSNLNGIVYYSRRAGKEKQLIEKCYRVESMSGNKHDDIIYTNIKPKINSMFLQKDNKFGTLIYKSELYNEGDNFILINTCLEEITKFIFTLNNKEEYKICSYFIYDKNKQGYFIYSFQVMQVELEFVLKTGLIGPTTFSNRLRASTVHLAKLLKIDWSDKLNAWPGKYDTYK